MGQGARKFLANYTILAAGDLCSKILLLWASVRMAHVLGADLYGNIAFAAAFTAYFSLLVSQGLGVYGMKEVARTPARVGEYAGSILALRLSACLIAGIALSLTVWLLPKPPEMKTLLLLYGLTFISSAIAMNWVFQAMEEMRIVAVATVLSQLVFSACILTFLNRPEQCPWVPVFQVGGEALAALFLFVNYARRYGAIRLAFDMRSWVTIWKESVPIGLSMALSLVLFNFDVVLMGFMKPPAEVGLYSAAYRYIAFFGSFLALYNVNIFPAIARCRDNTPVLCRISRKSMQYSLAITIPLAAGGTLVAHPLMELIFGPQFSAGAGALRILIWIIPIMAGRTIYRATLISHGFQKDYLWIALSAVAVNIGLNFLLIPSYSFLGAAVASVIGELLIFVMVYERVARKVVRLDLGSHLWRPLVACMPMVGFLHWAEGSGLAFLLAGGVAIYAISAYLVGAISPAEIWREIRLPEPGLRLNPDNIEERQ